MDKIKEAEQAFKELFRNYDVKHIITGSGETYCVRFEYYLKKAKKTLCTFNFSFYQDKYRCYIDVYHAILYKDAIWFLDEMAKVRHLYKTTIRTMDKIYE